MRWLEAPLRDLAPTRDTITGSREQAYSRWRSVSGKIQDYTRNETRIAVSDVYAYFLNMCFVIWNSVLVMMLVWLYELRSFTNSFYNTSRLHYKDQYI
jgi:hypothetical protein